MLLGQIMGGEMSITQQNLMLVCSQIHEVWVGCRIKKFEGPHQAKGIQLSTMLY